MNSSLRNKKNSMALVCERTIPTERPPLVDEVIVNYLWIVGVTWSARRIPWGRNLDFLDRSRYFFFQVAQLYSEDWVDPVPDPLKKSGSAENRIREPWICSQELWLLDHRGGISSLNIYFKMDVDINYGLRPLHSLDICNVADVSEVHVVSVF
jgi:hypothetical protein